MCIKNTQEVKLNPHRNICKTSSGKYRISKQKDNILYHFGAYDTLEDAMKVRDVIESVGWGFRLNPNRNIQKYSWGYYLRKWRDGELIYSESFKSLEEARKVRDTLESCDWEIDALDTSDIKDPMVKGCKVLFEKNTKGNKWEEWSYHCQGYKGEW